MNEFYDAGIVYGFMISDVKNILQKFILNYEQGINTKSDVEDHQNFKSYESLYIKIKNFLAEGKKTYEDSKKFDKVLELLTSIVKLELKDTNIKVYNSFDDNCIFQDKTCVGVLLLEDGSMKEKEFRNRVKEYKKSKKIKNFGKLYGLGEPEYCTLFRTTC